MIDVKQTGNADPFQFLVTVSEGNGETHHQVALSRQYCQKLGGATVAPGDLIEAIVRFLLEREPKETILSRFDVSVVSRYFPDFESALSDYLAN